MTDATDNIAKRVRFDDNDPRNNDNDHGPRAVAFRFEAPKAPLSTAESTVSTHLASLQPNLAPILEKSALDCIRSQAKAFNKANQITRMQNDVDFIPRRSARVAFKFNVSAAAEKSSAFISLKNDTNNIINAFQNR